VQFQDDEEQEREVEFEIKLDAEFPKGLVGFYLPANGAAEFQFFALKDNARP
jgi:hypothetical protein